MGTTPFTHDCINNSQSQNSRTTFGGLNVLRKSELVTTVTDESAMAKAAHTGGKRVLLSE
jgi:hypothetical protein